jgi:hypothetical protein
MRSDLKSRCNHQVHFQVHLLLLDRGCWSWSDQQIAALAIATLARHAGGQGCQGCASALQQQAAATWNPPSPLVGSLLFRRRVSITRYPPSKSRHRTILGHTQPFALPFLTLVRTFQAALEPCSNTSRFPSLVAQQGAYGSSAAYSPTSLRRSPLLLFFSFCTPIHFYSRV